MPGVVCGRSKAKIDCSVHLVSMCVGIFVVLHVYAAGAESAAWARVWVCEKEGASSAKRGAWLINCFKPMRTQHRVSKRLLLGVFAAKAKLACMLVSYRPLAHAGRVSYVSRHRIITVCTIKRVLVIRQRRARPAAPERAAPRPSPRPAAREPRRPPPPRRPTALK